ncbi:MAG: MBL fold metallo-hydrolase [Magnetococcales bacterium]|nr:MBL fold metallo-hydrolase [Magnetococcales bacterium]MBF0321688.1 MBL fold metallo-hydrolase [Magnetococcales bacterium]
MKIRFWGVRGSIACPGPHTVKYGGNTSCIEIRNDENDLIILDAGTGIFPLSHTLFKELPLTCHIFITHTHWDHIQGLPFFIPTFIPGNTICLHGAFDPVGNGDLREVLSRQMEYCYFPVREAELQASMHYITLRERQTVQVGSARVTNIFMNHPVLNFGYRIESRGKSVFFTGDHEPMTNVYDAGEDGFHEYQLHMDQKQSAIVEFMRGVDVLIADTCYTPEEYKSKKGWGHGTFDSNIALARAAGAKHLFFTHHEPTRSDAALEKVFQEAMERHSHQPGDPVCHLAQEGLVFEV